MKLAYEAFDRSGHAVCDVMDAASAAEATEALRRQGLFVANVGPAGAEAARSGAPALGRRRRTKLKDLAVFTRQMHVLLSTGTPLAQSLSALERQMKNDGWRAVLARVRAQVEEGIPLSSAMAEHPGYFSPVYRSLIAAGESSGHFAPMLDRLAILVKKQTALRNAVVGAMTYPLLLLVVSAAVLVLMLTVVLPRFAGLFLELDVPLPPTTVALLAVSHAMTSYWWIMLTAIAGVTVAARYWVKTPGGRRAVHTALVRLPAIGVVTRRLVTSRITRLLGVLVDSEIPVLEALDLTKQATGNLLYADLIAHAESAVARGQPISAAFADERLIEPSLYEAMQNGEQSGEIGTLLLTIADFMEQENEVTIRSLVNILEPMILIVLGLVVAFVAISMFMPLFDLTSMASGGGA